MAFKVAVKNSLFNYYVRSSFKNLVFVNQFAATPSLNPVSGSLQGFDAVEAEIMSLCRQPSSANLRKAFFLFEKSLDTGFIPSGRFCDLVLQTLSRNKDHKMAFSAYKKMTSAGVSPRYGSLSSLVVSLVYLGVPELALSAVALILKRGYLVHIYLANVVLNGFRCNGSTSKALNFLGEMERNTLAPDSVSFNTLIQGFCRERKLSEAMDVKKRMEFSRVDPNLITYSILIDGFVSEDNLDEALRLFEEMKGKGLEPDVIVCSTLIKGFCSRGDIDRAEELFNIMLSSRISPNLITYSCLLQGLCLKGELDKAMDLFQGMINNGIQPDVVVCTSMIGALSKIGKTSEAVKMLHFMLEKGISPNTLTYNILLKGLCQDGELDDASKIVEMMISNGKSPYVVNCNTVMGGLLDLGRVDDALNLFENFNQVKVEPDEHTISILVQGLCSEGRLEDAERITRAAATTMKNLNPILSYDVVIASYLKAGDAKKAMSLWKELLQLGITPDARAYSSLIDGLCKCCCTNIAKGIFMEMKNRGRKLTSFDYNALMSALSKESSMEQVRDLFEDMVSGNNCVPDVVSYNILIDSVIKAGDIQYAYKVMEDMLNAGLSPDALTYSVLINRLSKSGMTKEAKLLLKKMKASGHLPDEFVYDSLLKGFSTEGKQEEVISLLQEMATSGIILDNELISTIMSCFCDLWEDHDVTELLSSFRQSKHDTNGSITCGELLNRLQNIFPRQSKPASPSVLQ